MRSGRLLFIFLLSFCYSLSINAQISDGTTAPDWTATDIDGVTHNLYDILESGKHVVLEFSTTWCSICWNFHNTGTLETLHETYGPNGSDQIRVFYIESDPTTNLDCLFNLHGCNSTTQGDWVTGKDHPFITVTSSNGGSIPEDDYGVFGYPTIFVVSANDTNGAYNIGPETNILTWASWFFDSFEMDLAFDVQDALCPGDGSVQVTSINGSGAIDYAWSNGAGNTDFVENLEAGLYFVTATDNNGYEIVREVEVLGPAGGALAVELLTNSDVQCFGESNGVLSVDGSGGNGGYSFIWNTGSTSPIIDGLPAEDYSVVVTDIEGCTSEQTFVVTQPELLTLSSNSEDANCDADDGSVFAFATGGTGQWSYDYGSGPNNTGAFLEIAPGDYIMTVTDDNGCIEFSEFTINATESPLADAQSDDVIDCSTQEVLVSGSGSSEGDDITYAWTSDDGSIVSGENDIDAIVSSAGTYTLVVTNTETGCFSEVSVAVEENIELPTAMITDPTELNCEVITTILDGTDSSVGDNITYAWSTVDGNISSGANTSTPIADAAGEYTLLVTNTENGCTSIESVTVVADTALASISVPDFELDCSVSEVTLCADVDASTVVTWMIPNGELEGTCITVTIPGDYIAVAKGSNGCENTAISVVALSDDLPQVSQLLFESVTADVICNGANDGSITVTPSGGEPGYTISWVGPNGFTATDLELTDLAPGEYSMVLNDAFGYEKSDSYVIDQPTEIVQNSVEITEETNSDGNGSIAINVEGGSGELMFEWNNGQSTASLIDLPAGDYSVIVTDENGCQKEFGPFSVVSNTVGVEDLDFVTSLSTYPVPASNYLNVDVTLQEAQSIQMRVLDVYGELISTLIYTGSEINAKIDVSQMASGIYFIEIGNQKGRSLEKFIVVR